MGPVLVLGSAEKERVAEAIDDVKPRLEADFGIAAIDVEQKLETFDGIDATWALVFGGDGAVLNASRRMGNNPIPTLPVNFGRFGFLTEVESKQLPQALDRIKAGKGKVRVRLPWTLAQIGVVLPGAADDIVTSIRLTPVPVAGAEEKSAGD